ncbi:unnamed protein product [Symbiodinium natans]|uniref:C3H1-type domain-containing protein n=1 Tax=Symbiodinium natans TaxID=878477 RepID=A0A812SW26_9DINO|nr:unnamed protein product [Symbiodinium natans]
MSARTLNLLADSQEAVSPVLGKLREGSEGFVPSIPSPPPGLEFQTCSELAEGAESSSASTYFDGFDDSELASLPTDGRLWCQTQFDAIECDAAVGGLQHMILATTPISPSYMDWSLSSGVGPWPGAMAPHDVCYGFDDTTGFAMPEVQMQVPEQPTPPLPTPSLPAMTGSMAHEDGTCKPCAFVYTKGCQSGMQCAFCHLCPPGEKDRRKKVKHIMARIRRKGKPGAGQ